MKTNNTCKSKGKEKPNIHAIRQKVQSITYTDSNIKENIDMLVSYKINIYNWLTCYEKKYKKAHMYEQLYDIVNNMLEKGLRLFIEKKYDYTKKFKDPIEKEFLKKIEDNFPVFLNKAKTLENVYQNAKFIFDYKKIDFGNLILENEKKIIQIFFQKIDKIYDSNIEKINDPIDPDIVLFGLILVSFLPLNIFPKTSPPISDIIATIIEYKR